MADTPADLGFRMPAEWEPHEATWIAWPHRKDDWPGKLAAVRWAYTEIVRHLHRSETVHILVNDARQEGQARRHLAKAGADLARIDFLHAGTDRSWTRDTGPLFVVGPGGTLAATDWRFNAWAKYPEWTHDDQVAARIAEAVGVRRWELTHAGRRVVLEGGSIDVNGHGLLLTTEECLLSPVQERNPGLGRAALESLLAAYLGVQKVLWLGRGIAGDDTHGHVDDLARFVAPRTVVTVTEDDPADENYAPLQENLDRLRAMTDTEGRPLEVIELPMPDPIVFDNRRLPASYANFYIANDRVLVPTFNDLKDRVALGILADLFPTRQVVGIHSVDLVWGLGTLHCLTQQQPRGA